MPARQLRERLNKIEDERAERVFRGLDLRFGEDDALVALRREVELEHIVLVDGDVNPRDRGAVFEAIARSQLISASSYSKFCSNWPFASS